MINEPTAAALCYGFIDRSINQKILVFDLGGGAFDVSIFDLSYSSEKHVDNIKHKSFKVLSNSGDTQLGGEDFGNELVNYCMSWRKESEKEMRGDNQAIKGLKIACENVKNY